MTEGQAIVELCKEAESNMAGDLLAAIFDAQANSSQAAFDFFDHSRTEALETLTYIRERTLDILEAIPYDPTKWDFENALTLISRAVMVSRISSPELDKRIKDAINATV